MNVNVQDFFKDFYDRMIFHPVFWGLDFKWFFLDTAYNEIVKIDKLFGSVDRDAFRKEMIALRMELIAFSFYIHNSKKDELLLAQSVFTKNYLQDNGSLDIWDTMLEYNKVISESSCRHLEGNRPLWRGCVSFHNNFMFNKCKEFLNTHNTDGTDPVCIGRVCNRYTSEIAWKKHFTERYLMSKLVERINCNKEINPDALMGIIATFMGFYQGADKAVSAFN